MSPKNLVVKSFTWAVVFTTLFVLALGAVLLSLVVGDWIFIHTADRVLSWFVGIFVLCGFLVTLGAGIGFFLWLRGPETPAEVVDRNDTMDVLIKDASVLQRD